MRNILLAFAFLAVGSLAASVHHHHCPTYHVDIIRKTSHNAHGLRSAVDHFRHLLGGQNNGANIGPFKYGRREINWDGGAPFDMPFDFFNEVAPLGAIFHTKGNKFAISNPLNNHPVDDKFSSINKPVSKEFIAFSEKRLFTPVSDNVVTQFFRVPGTKKRATTSGFGAVFVDVDKSHTSFLTLYDFKGCRIAKVAVPPKNRGLSFVGIRVKGVSHGYFNRAPVFKAELKLGNRLLKDLSHGGDRVVTDDFIYGEPQEI